MKILTQNLKIKATKGKKTIADSDMFAYPDSDFENYGTNEIGVDTKETEIAVLEMDKNATFKQMYEGYDLDKACMSQGQILEFIKSHKEHLRTDGHATFFLFKVAEKFFVAGVRVNGVGTLFAHVYRFSYDPVWRADYRRRVVVPQLALDSFESSPLDSLNLNNLEERISKIEKWIRKEAGFINPFE